MRGWVDSGADPSEHGRTQRLAFSLFQKLLEIRLVEGNISLWLDGCLRKAREVSGDHVLYLWTNVELMWEEHRLVEVRYTPADRHLEVCLNGRNIRESDDVVVTDSTFEGFQK